jgi:hypothetical protein
MQPDAFRPRPTKARPFPWPTVVATVGAGIVGIGVFVGMQATHRDPVPRSATAAMLPSVSPPPAVAETVLDADEAFGRARSEAHRWNKDAVLAGMEAGPFSGGRLEPEGKLEIWFGAPSGAHVGPGAGLQREHLVVTVTSAGLTTRKEARAGSVGLADPNCIVQDVWKELVPAIVPHDSRLRLSYGRGGKDRRAVWKVLPEGKSTPLRTLDGANCTFLVP